jgi:hypothetical protein
MLTYNEVRPLQVEIYSKAMASYNIGMLSLSSYKIYVFRVSES